MARAKVSKSTGESLAGVQEAAKAKWPFGRQNKYNAKKTTVEGYTCDSKMEAARFEQLLAARSEKLVAEVVFHPRVMLDLTKYEADFLVVGARLYWKEFPVLEDGRSIPVYHWYEDVKGQETARFREVRKYWRKYGHLPLRILKRQGKNDWKSEWIIPDSMEPTE